MERLESVRVGEMSPISRTPIESGQEQTGKHSCLEPPFEERSPPSLNRREQPQSHHPKPKQIHLWACTASHLPLARSQARTSSGGDPPPSHPGNSARSRRCLWSSWRSAPLRGVVGPPCDTAPLKLPLGCSLPPRAGNQDLH